LAKVLLQRIAETRDGLVGGTSLAGAVYLLTLREPSRPSDATDEAGQPPARLVVHGFADCWRRSHRARSGRLTGIRRRERYGGNACLLRDDRVWRWLDWTAVHERQLRKRISARVFRGGAAPHAHEQGLRRVSIDGLFAPTADELHRAHPGLVAPDVNRLADLDARAASVRNMKPRRPFSLALSEAGRLGVVVVSGDHG
jgi:hypothetical protein